MLIERYNEVKKHVEEACKRVGRDPREVTVIAVSKTKPIEMIEEAIDVIMESRQASTSMLQRRLKLGYSRAARIIDQIEERGIIGPFEGSKPRQILISREEWQEMKLRRNMPIE